MQRYDVAIIGSGTEGLVAAILLARARLNVIVLERGCASGGRATTQEFHPGFRASPYADELGAMPGRLFDSLGLARAGAILVPAPISLCVSDHGITALYTGRERMARAAPREARDELLALMRAVEETRDAIAARARAVAPRPAPNRFAFWKRQAPPTPWPGEDLAQHALDDFLSQRLGDPALRLHLAADGLSGRAASPLLGGTALHLLGTSSGRSGMAPGGLHSLSAALAGLAQTAGAALRLEAPIGEIAVKERRLTRLVLTGGEEIEARAVLSTLDLKATFLSLMRWSDAEADALKRIAQFRIAGQTARILIALDAAPDFSFTQDHPEATRGPLHFAASMQALNRSYHSWHSGALDETLPITLRLPSATDPRLAPVGKAVMTATIGCVPARLFDGGWTEPRRQRLAAMALQAAQRAAPGIVERVVGIKTIVGPDIEAALGLTAGDLDGGEIAPDQMFGFRPMGNDPAWADGRTPIHGLYLAGPSSAPAPFFCGVAGERAAAAILADAKAGRLA